MQQQTFSDYWRLIVGWVAAKKWGIGSVIALAILYFIATVPLLGLTIWTLSFLLAWFVAIWCIFVPLSIRITVAIYGPWQGQTWLIKGLMGIAFSGIYMYQGLIFSEFVTTLLVETIRQGLEAQ